MASRIQRQNGASPIDSYGLRIWDSVSLHLSRYFGTFGTGIIQGDTVCEAESDGLDRTEIGEVLDGGGLREQW